MKFSSSAPVLLWTVFAAPGGCALCLEVQDIIDCSPTVIKETGVYVAMAPLGVSRRKENLKTHGGC